MPTEKITTHAQAKSVLDKYETFLFDCDGVIWCGAEALEGVGAAVTKLQEKGKKVIFVSNNSTKDRAQYVAKFAKMGIKAEEADVFSSGYATAKYLETHNVKTAYVLGEKGLEMELGKITTLISDNSSNSTYNPDVQAAKELPEVDAVVVGMDFGFNMVKLSTAIRYLRRPKADGTYPLHILTNPDAVIPINGEAMPEAATISAAITANTTAPPDAIVGKPNPLLFSVITAAYPSIDASTTVMVGDRIDTDIKFGEAAGVDSMLVLTGFQKEADLAEAQTQPTYVVDGVAKLVQLAVE